MKINKIHEAHNCVKLANEVRMKIYFPLNFTNQSKEI